MLFKLLIFSKQSIIIFQRDNSTFPFPAICFTVLVSCVVISL